MSHSSSLGYIWNFLWISKINIDCIYHYSCNLYISNSILWPSETELYLICVSTKTTTVNGKFILVIHSCCLCVRSLSGSRFFLSCLGLWLYKVNKDYSRVSVFFSNVQPSQTMKIISIWTLAGNSGTRREPTHAQREHTNSMVGFKLRTFLLQSTVLLTAPLSSPSFKKPFPLTLLQCRGIQFGTFEQLKPYLKVSCTHGLT